ncbi:MAG: GTPase Era [Bacteroidia bacterium]|nr:GTPase Era [Bacteroidia bacterium]
MDISSSYKAGFVSIVGKPNAGKSTLLNALLGQKLCITTPKAQTTRHRILGIDSTETYQIIYSDTPGVIIPKYKLHEKMMSFVGNALEDADVIIVLIAADEQFPEDAFREIIQKQTVPKILAINKTDIVSPEVVAQKREEWSSLFQFEAVEEISALKKMNLDTLKAKLIELLPESPPFYDPEEVTDRPERFFVAELIREQLFLQLEDEVPYSTEVNITQFKDKGEIVSIYAEIYVERQSQKGIVIGKQGSKLKLIGSRARVNIEKLLEKKVFLELFVKVRDDWKNNPGNLKHFGY